MGRKKVNCQQDGGPKGHKSAKTKSKDEPIAVGCHIPLGCELGAPVKEGDESLLMICENDECPHKNQPVHRQCLDELERKLLRRLRTTRPSNEWSEKHRHDNLWQWKGMRVHQCKCNCGSYTQPQAEEVEKKPKGQKPKKKCLPTIQVSSDHRQARLASLLSRDEKESAVPVVAVPVVPTNGRREELPARSRAASESMSLQSEESNCHESASVFAPEEECGYVRPQRRSRGGRGRGRRGAERRRDLRSSSSTLPPHSLPNQHETELVPAREAPKQSISYAATLKRSSTPIRAGPAEDDEGIDVASDSPLQSTPSQHISEDSALHCSPPSSPSAGSNDISDLPVVNVAEVLLRSETPTDWEAVYKPAGLATTALLSQYVEGMESEETLPVAPVIQDSKKGSVQDDYRYISSLPAYDPFSGGFRLAESILGWSRLPPLRWQLPYG